MTDVLQDIRVVEFSDGCSAAFCGRLFARLGAEVVLIERPRVGSAVRWEPPFLDDRAGVERGGLFMFTASGKRSLTLDPASPDGTAILGRLLEPRLTAPIRGWCALGFAISLPAGRTKNGSRPSFNSPRSVDGWRNSASRGARRS
jgi:hypothetical protein